jgi:hypothetical protein
MTTNQPIDLGRVSEETKTTGLGSGDSASNPFAQEGT